ncbi:MAG: sigma-70 family RNA polymerase sigma factor [Clostridia bacterium]|nr:sigma-70 family RNA polymerase sigma factor [Clostridia bacterium]
MEQNLDKDLIMSARAGNSESLDQLFLKYKSLAKKLSRRYFLADGDTDDLFQEAMIGLFKAIQNYDLNSNSDFKTFASLCINRRLLTTIKASNRMKNKILSSALSLNSQGAIEIAGADEELWFFVPSNRLDAEAELISKETTDEMLKKISEMLSDFEKKVLKFYLEGKSYKDIGAKINKSTKSVENALIRIKTKLSFLKN